MDLFARYPQGGISAFTSDLSSGFLPDFSLIRPGVGHSGEPWEDTQPPNAWVGQLVTSIERSPLWKSTAIFVTYDEGGGFWDHVSTPAADRRRIRHADADIGRLALHEARRLPPADHEHAPTVTGLPATVNLASGTGSFTVKFPVAGYYRLTATGPNGSQGWVTIGAGVTALTP